MPNSAEKDCLIAISVNYGGTADFQNGRLTEIIVSYTRSVSSHLTAYSGHGHDMVNSSRSCVVSDTIPAM